MIHKVKSITLSTSFVALIKVGLHKFGEQAYVFSREHLKNVFHVKPL